VKHILTVTLLVAAVSMTAAAQKGGPYQVGEDGVKAPILTREVKPTYTGSAMQRGVQGNVEVEAVVLADGTVGDVTVKKSLDPELDEQAVTATKQWGFRPGTKDGKAVDVLVQIELTFTLKAKK
jgi:periplasmic protein TonB